MFVECVFDNNVEYKNSLELHNDAEMFTNDSTFYVKIHEKYEVRINNQTLYLALLGTQEAVKLSFPELLLENVEILDIDDHVNIYVMLMSGRIYRIVVNDLENITDEFVHTFEPIAFSSGASPLAFHCTDPDNIVVSLTGGQLHLITCPLRGSTSNYSLNIS